MRRSRARQPLQAVAAFQQTDHAPLRASLVWSHPDANLGLWAGYPGLGLSRPVDLTPEYGIEVFDVREVENGTYRVEVRRQGDRHLTAVDAKLVVVWREGAADERVEIRNLRFTNDQRSFGFTIAGDTLSEAPTTAPPGVRPPPAGGRRPTPVAPVTRGER